MVVGKGEAFAVVELAAVAKFPGTRDVRLGDIHAVGFIARLGKPRHDLAHAAAHVQYPRPRFRRAQGVRVFGVKVGVPVFEKFRVSFIMAIGLLMAHFDLRFAIADFRRVAPGVAMVSDGFGDFFIATT